jgi:hypothetical protein
MVPIEGTIVWSAFYGLPSDCAIRAVEFAANEAAWWAALLRVGECAPSV